ncbi:membrane hypothetical protein [Vibrio chagasii]|nr:membrane hypothetical protein [Vibrio chagasii]
MWCIDFITQIQKVLKLLQTLTFLILLTVIGFSLGALYKNGSTGVKVLCVTVGVILASMAVTSLFITSLWQHDYVGDLIQQRGEVYSFATQILFDIESDRLHLLLNHSMMCFALFICLIMTLTIILFLANDDAWADKILPTVVLSTVIVTLVVSVLFLPVTSPSKVSAYKLDAKVSESVVEHYRNVCPLSSSVSISTSSVSISTYKLQKYYELRTKCGSTGDVNYLKGTTQSYRGEAEEEGDSQISTEYKMAKEFISKSGRRDRNKGVRHEVMLKGEPHLVFVMNSKYTPPEGSLAFHNEFGHQISRNLSMFVDQQVEDSKELHEDDSEEWAKVQLH